MSRQWRGCRRGLGEDQGPVTLHLHAVNRLSAAGLGFGLSLSQKTQKVHFINLLYINTQLCSIAFFFFLGDTALTFVLELFVLGGGG